MSSSSALIALLWISTALHFKTTFQRYPFELLVNGYDGNGYIDDIHGYDFYGNDGDPRDGHSHGTHCAGTIGAVGNNNRGVVGVNWNVQIMAVQIFNAQGQPTSADRIAAAIDYSADNGARVLSNSWGGGPASTAIRSAITRVESRGVLFVAAAGNSSSDTDQYPHYPSSYSNANVISVLSIDHREQLSGFSNHGKLSVDLGAPGSAIKSTTPGESYQFKSGTSMATPHVAGALALIWGHPKYAIANASKIKEALLKHTRPLESLRRKCLTAGTLDISFLGDAFPTQDSASPDVRIQDSELKIKTSPTQAPNIAQTIDSNGQRLDTLAGYQVLRIEFHDLSFNENGNSWITKSKVITPPAGWRRVTVSLAQWDLHFGHDYYEHHPLAHIGAQPGVRLSGQTLEVLASAILRDRNAARPWRGTVRVKVTFLGN